MACHVYDILWVTISCSGINKCIVLAMIKLTPRLCGCSNDLRTNASQKPRRLRHYRINKCCFLYNLGIDHGYFRIIWVGRNIKSSVCEKINWSIDLAICRGVCHLFAIRSLLWLNGNACPIYHRILTLLCAAPRNYRIYFKWFKWLFDKNNDDNDRHWLEVWKWEDYG